ncbi:MAG: histidine kinase [Planctomycetaceae bacterium]|nr:histidine kinase [Planctomycetaceae bacterium]
MGRQLEQMKSDLNVAQSELRELREQDEQGPRRSDPVEDAAAVDCAAEVERFNLAIRASSGRLTENSGLRDYLSHILSTCSELLEVEFGHVFTFDPTDSTFEFTVGLRSGQIYFVPRPDDPTLFSGRHAAIDFPVYRESRARPRTTSLTCEEIRSPPPAQIAQWFATRSVGQTMTLLLLTGDRPVGFIGLGFLGAPGFRRSQIEFFHAIANHAALSLELHHLAEQARRSAVVEERNRLAREIHDTLAQGFAGISVQLEAAKRILPRSPEKAMECVTEAIGLARHGLSEVRRSIWDLRPSDLDGGDLESALRRLIARLRSVSQAALALEIHGVLVRLAPMAEHELFRIAQEALSNSIRYAHAQRITVDLTSATDAIELSITDDGRGFNLIAASVTEGFGLINMHERADRIGAGLTVSSDLGSGTRVNVKLMVIAGSIAND